MGLAYRATRTQDLDVVSLRWKGSEPPVGGFVESVPGSYKMSVRVEELDSLSFVEWRCEYRGEPFVVNDEDAGTLFVTYAGDSEVKARELGMDVTGRFLATGEIPRVDVENLREVKKQFWPKDTQVWTGVNGMRVPRIGVEC